MQWDRQKVLAYNLSAIPPYPLPFPVSPFCLFVYWRDATFPLTCIYQMTWLRPIDNLQFLDRQVLYRGGRGILEWFLFFRVQLFIRDWGHFSNRGLVFSLRFYGMEAYTEYSIFLNRVLWYFRGRRQLEKYGDRRKMAIYCTYLLVRDRFRHFPKTEGSFVLMEARWPAEI